VIHFPAFQAIVDCKHCDLSVRSDCSVMLVGKTVCLQKNIQNAANVTFSEHWLCSYATTLPGS